MESIEINNNVFQAAVRTKGRSDASLAAAPDIGSRAVLRAPAGVGRPAGATPDDPSVGRGQYIFAGSLIVLLVVGGVLLTPIANRPEIHIPGYMSAFGAFMVVINALLAALLFTRGMIDAESGAIRLGTTYFFIAVIFVPLMAAFPGGFVAEPLIGTHVSSVWLWAFWHTGLGLGIIRYALGRSSVPASVPRSMLGAVVIVILLTLVATIGVPYLPAMLADGHRLFTGFGAFVPPGIIGILVVALVLVIRRVKPSQQRLWLIVGLVAACFDVWLTYHGTSRFSIGWYIAKCGSLLTSLSMLISLMYDVTALRHRLVVANATLQELAHRDGLTGLPNRRVFDETIDLEWRRARRAREPISIMMIDVDFFKAYNDHYGHLQGDDCLRQIAGALQGVARRPTDRVARFGGEEFVIILASTTVSGPAELAGLLHASLRSLAVAHELSPFGHVTVSIGLATMVPEPDGSYEDLLRLADARLYLAKQHGRNRTEGDEAAAQITMTVA
jgi:diguanylate cyclase (GGDEF)-like protein